jgi:guanylate kinase
MKNKMVILIGPSGVGKSSFLDRILVESKDLCDTVTYTTRAMRPGESEGKPYHFVSRERFEELLIQDFFVEHAHVHGQLYGTPFYQIHEAWKNARSIIMDVDVQGALTFKSKFPDSFAIFILPPSIEALRQRVIKRNLGRAPEDLEVRMKNAEAEIALASRFNAQVTNDRFEEAYSQVKNLIEEYLRNR